MKDAATEIASLARLLETGTIRAGKKNELLIRRLETARWVMLGNRKDEWVLRPERTADIENRLLFLLPSWRTDFEFLRSIGRNHFNSSDIEALPMLRRNSNPSGRLLNRRNWNAASGVGPKHRAKIPAQSSLTKDWVLRIRPNKGLIGVMDKGEVDLYCMASSWTECVIPERAWMGFRGLCGELPKVIITCENLGAYIDLPVRESTMVVYSPGADTEAAIALLKMLPEVLWMHFGDLDPEGVVIAVRIANETGRPLKLAIPDFVMDYLDAAKPVETPWQNTPDIEILNALKGKERRIFQEVFMLDDRLPSALDQMGI
ncbi:MAG: hypothetical protein HOP24_09150 [Sideroxydans sp.]|nr:hypothetical protein [Sideroxydans sp.]